MGRYKGTEWSGTKQKILMLHMRGKKQTEIAKKLGGKTDSTISVHMNSPEFAERKEKLEAGIREKVIKKFADKALWATDSLVKIAEKGVPEDRIRFDALKEILYMVGCKPVEIVETRTRDYSPEEINSAMLIMKEVESITNRLSTKKSAFILDKKKEEIPTLPPAPCQESQKSLDTQKEESHE